MPQRDAGQAPWANSTPGVQTPFPSFSCLHQAFTTCEAGLSPGVAGPLEWVFLARPFGKMV